MKRDILIIDGILRKGVDVKHTWIRRLVDSFEVTAMCEVLSVSR